MTRGLIIPAVQFLPPVEQDFSGLADYQSAVNGYIEPVPFADPCLMLYVNEDGRSRQMSVNERATALWWLLTPAARGQQLIVGDAVLLVEQGADSNIIDLLQREQAFHVEVQLGITGDEWVEGPRNFPSWFEAAKFALALLQRFDFVANARVAST